MGDTTVPFWLANTIFLGREGEEDEGSDEGNNSEDDGEEGSEEEGSDNSDEGRDDDDGEGDDEDVTSLKRALAKERKATREERKLRRKAERDARNKQEKQENDEESKANEKVAEDLRKEREKSAKLAAGLLRRERDNAILAEARRQGFIDPSDALTDTIREAVDIDQDPEDPSDIEVDEDSVVDAVKALAAKKKHLVGQGGEGTPSGSRRRRKGSSDGVDDKFLDSTYNI